MPRQFAARRTGRCQAPPGGVRPRQAEPDPALVEIPEVLAGLDAVTAEDVGRVAKALLAPEKLRFAAIGPFEDEARFEALLG